MHRVSGDANRNTSSYQWLPDGRTLAFLTGDYRSESDFDWPDRLALLRVDGGRGPVLTDHRGLGGYSLSPDGRAVLAQVGNDLVVQPIASDGPRQVIGSAGYFSDWSWCARALAP
jgi:Tol biopolymer transport system component